ncbi:MAG: hypothetical protein F4Y45_01115 [Acidobacteria bacterium]|nr:hypothetical protein [Acidobacteriota bacterium]MYD69348.1 hypothetical protein [Acidobacteriota bacterium]MYJ04796.1 hypothetical protein [Acidobacteriota bacterium]
MNRLARAAVLTKLMDALQTRGSRCGETHIQKAVYFLQELKSVHLGFDFVLYKYGPYSFDLRDELTSLRADGLVQLASGARLGSRFETTDRTQCFHSRFSRTLEAHEASLEFVAERVDNKGAADLERYATALHVVKSEPTVAERDQVGRLTLYKPHIADVAATEAVRKVKDWIAEAKGAQ